VVASDAVRRPGATLKWGGVTLVGSPLVRPLLWVVGRGSDRKGRMEDARVRGILFIRPFVRARGRRSDRKGRMKV